MARNARSRRSRGTPRAFTLGKASLERVLAEGGDLSDVEDIERPRTRGDCEDAPRPCPWVGCRHHLYLDLNPDTGSIKLNHPDREPWELVETCSLDVAARDGSTLEAIGLLINVTRERARQIETHAAVKLIATLSTIGIDASAQDDFPHPEGSFIRSPGEGREESAKRARAAYQQRQRAARSAR